MSISIVQKLHSSYLSFCKYCESHYIFDEFIKRIKCFRKITKKIIRNEQDFEIQLLIFAHILISVLASALVSFATFLILPFTCSGVICISQQHLHISTDYIINLKQFSIFHKTVQIFIFSGNIVF